MSKAAMAGSKRKADLTDAKESKKVKVHKSKEAKKPKSAHPVVEEHDEGLDDDFEGDDMDGVEETVQEDDDMKNIHPSRKAGATTGTDKDLNGTSLPHTFFAPDILTPPHRDHFP